MQGQNPREIAVELLGVWEKRGTFVEKLLEETFEKRQLKPEDRRFLQELVFGSVRWRGTLDWLISRKTSGKGQTMAVQNLLRLALYQMFWLDRVPDYAAVNETVEVAKKHASAGAAKFINAVLRGYGREEDATRAQLDLLKKNDPPTGYSHPAWLVHRWELRWGSPSTIQLLEWNNSPPPLFARLNRLKSSLDILLKAWEAEGVESIARQLDWLPDSTVFQITKSPSIATLRSFQEGCFYIQDPSTLLAVELLNAKPGESILDMCSAPGGKTAYLAEKIENSGRILAEDIEPQRLELVDENCARLGASVVATRADTFPEGAAFDRILLDAPCSNTGVMRRRVELRWRVSPDEIARLARLQLDLLQKAALRLKRGGTILYSTCSLEREENNGVIRAFLAEHPSFVLQAERELWPFRDGVDGAYVARLSN